MLLPVLSGNPWAGCRYRTQRGIGEIRCLFLYLFRGCDLKINKPLIVGVLSILFLFLALLILYARTTDKVNINSASREALINLPDIGPVLAERIISGRPYEDIYELDRVKGIGPETIEAIKDKVIAGEL